MDKPIPDEYRRVTPYIIVVGADRAVDFYKRVFGASERMRMPRPDGKIGHAEIEIGDSVIMLADESPQSDAYAPAHYGGSPITLLIYSEDCDATYQRALSAGATSVREPADQPYGDRMSGVKDPFGHTWFIATHIKDVDFGT